MAAANTWSELHVWWQEETVYSFCACAKITLERDNENLQPKRNLSVYRFHSSLRAQESWSRRRNLSVFLTDTFQPQQLKLEIIWNIT